MTGQIRKKILKLGRVPAWVILSMFLVSAVISAAALRHNNQTMIQLRNKVYAADKNSGDVNGALNNLRAYVYAHMNTNLTSGGNTIKPPIQLKYSYERLEAAELQRVKDANTRIYTDAQNYCQAQNPIGFSGRVRVPCVQNYVTSHGVKANPIPTALYEFDFLSPAWSPDLAGWSLLVSFLLLLALAASFTMDRMVRHKLRPL